MSLGSWPIPRPPSLSRWSARGRALLPRPRGPCPAWRAGTRRLRGQRRRSVPTPTRAGRSKEPGSRTPLGSPQPSGPRRLHRRSSPAQEPRSAPSAPSRPSPAPPPDARATKRLASDPERPRPAAARANPCSVSRSPLASPARDGLAGDRIVGIPGRRFGVAVAVPARVPRLLRRRIASFRGRLQEPRCGESGHQADSGDHPWPPTCEVLDVTQELVSARPLEVRPGTFDPVGGTLGDASRLPRLAVLPELLAAAAKRLGDLPSLLNCLRRPLVERIAELAPAALLGLARCLLRARCDVLHLRGRLPSTPFLAGLVGRIRNAEPFLRVDRKQCGYPWPAG